MSEMRLGLALHRDDPRPCEHCEWLRAAITRNAEIAITLRRSIVALHEAGLKDRQHQGRTFVDCDHQLCRHAAMVLMNVLDPSDRPPVPQRSR